MFPVLFVLLNNGVSENPTTRFFQIGGLTASFLSVSKFCAEWHLFTAFNLNEDHKIKIPTKLLPVFKAMAFFVSHTVFRTASLSVVAAYFRLYALIPLSVFVIVSLPVGSYAVYSKISCDGMMNSLFTLPLYIFTPATLAPDDKDFRKVLKSTMLLSTLILLPCLLLIRLLPLLPSSTIHCTLGLSHININWEDIPECSPCFNNNTASDNTTMTNISGTDFTPDNMTSSGKFKCLLLQPHIINNNALSGNNASAKNFTPSNVTSSGNMSNQGPNNQIG